VPEKANQFTQAFLTSSLALYQDYSDGSGDDKFKCDVTVYGPMLGLAIRF